MRKKKKKLESKITVTIEVDDNKIIESSVLPWKDLTINSYTKTFEDVILNLTRSALRKNNLVFVFIDKL